MRLNFDLPIIAKARCGRSPTIRTVLGSVPYACDIQEIDLSAAPLALAFQQKHTQGYGGLARIEYRAHDGDLWTEIGECPTSDSIQLEIGKYGSVSSPFYDRNLPPQTPSFMAGIGGVEHKA